MTETETKIAQGVKAHFSQCYGMGSEPAELEAVQIALQIVQAFGIRQNAAEITEFLTACGVTNGRLIAEDIAEADGMIY